MATSSPFLAPRTRSPVATAASSGQWCGYAALSAQAREETVLPPPPLPLPLPVPSQGCPETRAETSVETSRGGASGGGKSGRRNGGAGERLRRGREWGAGALGCPQQDRGRRRPLRAAVVSARRGDGEGGRAELQAPGFRLGLGGRGGNPEGAVRPLEPDFLFLSHFETTLFF